MSKTLKLTLKKEWFDLMVSGVKKVEIRSPSEWIKSRLIDRSGQPKKYDFVEFTNGYGSDKPKFTCVYLGFIVALYDYKMIFDPSIVEVKEGDFIIKLGKIIRDRKEVEKTPCLKCGGKLEVYEHRNGVCNDCTYKKGLV